MQLTWLYTEPFVQNMERFFGTLYNRTEPFARSGMGHPLPLHPCNCSIVSRRFGSRQSFNNWYRYLAHPKFKRMTSEVL